MTRLSEQPAKKLAPLMHSGERLLAAVQFEHLNSDAARNQRLEAYGRQLGCDVDKDLAYTRRAIYGYFGVSSRRVIVARSPVFWKVKPKHVLIDALAEQCTLNWYDFEANLGAGRAMLVQAPNGQYASFSVSLKWLGQFGKGQEEALRALADAIVSAFGPRARMTPPEN